MELKLFFKKSLKEKKTLADVSEWECALSLALTRDTAWKN